MNKLFQHDFENPDGAEAPARRVVTRGRPKVISDAKQAALIVKAAWGLFVERGYSGLTMEDVARECHVSKRTLYRHFATKLDLFAALVDEHRQTMLALPGNYDHLSLEEAIGAIFLLNIDEAMNRERIAFLRLVMVEAQQFPALEELLYKRGALASRHLLSAWLSREKEKGSIAVEDVDSAAWILMDLLFGAIAQKSPVGLDLREGDERRAYLRRCVDVFLNGVRKR